MDRSKKIKVLFVIPGEVSGPSMIFVKRQVDSIEKKGIAVDRFFLASRTSPVQVFKELNRLKARKKKFAPDIIHAQFGTMTSFLCSFFFRSKLIVTIRGCDVTSVKGINPIINFIRIVLTHVAVLKADVVVCVSENLRQRMWWGSRKTRIIPTGVNLALFREISRDDACKCLNLDVSHRFILFNAGAAGLVAMKKRIDLAEEVFSFVKQKVDAARLLILRGDVDPDRVYLYHNAADCLLMVSDNEGSPNIVKEALACNLPVVSVDVGDVKERLKGVFPSMVVERDSRLIADAVISVLNAEKRSNGRKAVKDISEENVAMSIISIYEEMCLSR
jgi:teichuronic acid biosynthesis glycosyltransferase TuaC